MPRGGPFATFLIVGPVCFFLGVLFSSFPYDYYVLWAAPPDPTTVPPPFDAITANGSLPGSATFLGTTQPAESAAREPYLALMEAHMRFLHASPPLISRLLHLVMATGAGGLVWKLYKPNESNMLFDGASLVLYVCGVILYISNIVKGLRVVTSGVYNDVPEELLQAEIERVDNYEPGQMVGREDSLKVMAASNTILALVLMGVLVLQAGQWYAAKKEAQEIEEMDRVSAEKNKARAEGRSGNSVTSSGGAGEKKKQ